MLFVGALHPVSEVKLQARVALTAVIDVADDRQESWLIGARVEDGMKLPVQPSPSRNMFLATKFADVLLEHLLRLRKILFRQMGNGELQHLGLEQGTNREELFDVLRRQ